MPSDRQNVKTQFHINIAVNYVCVLAVVDVAAAAALCHKTKVSENL